MNISSKNMFFSVDQEINTRIYTFKVLKLRRIFFSLDLLWREIRTFCFPENTELKIVITDLP